MWQAVFFLEQKSLASQLAILSSREILSRISPLLQRQAGSHFMRVKFCKSFYDCFFKFILVGATQRRCCPRSSAGEEWRAQEEWSRGSKGATAQVGGCTVTLSMYSNCRNCIPVWVEQRFSNISLSYLTEEMWRLNSINHQLTNYVWKWTPAYSPTNKLSIIFQWNSAVSPWKYCRCLL